MLPGARGDRRGRRDADLDVVRLRGAADGPRRGSRAAAGLGRAPRARTGSSTTARNKNAVSIDGLPGLRRMSFSSRIARARARMAELDVDVVLLLGRCRSSVPHRVRGDAARTADDARAPARRRRAARRAAARSAARRARSPTCSRSSRGRRPTIPIALVAKLAGSPARAAIGDQTWARFVLDLQRAAAGDRVRPARPRSSVRCAWSRTTRRSPRCAAPRTRSTSSRPRCASRPFAGRTELDVHRELVERMLARRSRARRTSRSSRRASTPPARTTSRRPTG